LCRNDRTTQVEAASGGAATGGFSNSVAPRPHNIRTRSRSGGHCRPKKPNNEERTGVVAGPGPLHAETYFY